MPLTPQTLSVNTDLLKPEDLCRGIAAVYVEATCERFTYLSSPQRPFAWHIYMKLAGGRGPTGAWDVVELCQVKVSTSLNELQDWLKVSSKTYPDFDSPESLEESRFRCTLRPTANLIVKDVFDLVSTKVYVQDADAPSVWTEDVGKMQWCLDIVRALKESQLLTPESEDKLMSEFESSSYRFELANGFTLVV